MTARSIACTHRKPQQQARLADARVADQQELRTVERTWGGERLREKTDIPALR